MSQLLPIVRTVDDLRARVAQWRVDEQTVALVPTMGALHVGHLSLLDVAHDKADKVVVSIFVNPTQFAPNEDLARYPRDEQADVARLAERGVDLVYAPTPEVMYPEGFATRIDVATLSSGLCAVSRPHHFSGVATVVCKLFTQCEPDVAVFGEKDYQQLLVIRRMARDLDLPVTVLSGATVRESDGLAMSSRNAYMTETERKIAPMLHRTLTEIASDVAAGRALEESVEAGKDRLTRAGFEIDYLELRDGRTLEPIDGAEVPSDALEHARLFVAAQLGKTRLIDNIAVAQ